MSTLVLTAVAMIAFAANALLCRLALGENLIDPASFMTIRAVSGAATLALVMLPRWRAGGRLTADWRAAAMLFAYMVFFTFAYRTLAAGTGTLLLFGAVQLTMFAAAMREGEPFPPLAVAGLALAVAGLVYLVSPGIAAPDPLGAAFMAIAGLAWGAYSLLGRRAAAPLEATAANFIGIVPLTLAVSVAFAGRWHASAAGVVLAAASGAFASGLGYVVWYRALRGLRAGRAAIVQLSVPVIAAFGGVAWLGEALTPRLVLASIATLGGIAIVLAARSARVARAARSV